MKRKLLLEFADTLARSRRPFYLLDCEQCVSAHAVRFAIARGSQVHKGRSTGWKEDLERIFGLTEDQAANLYSAPSIPISRFDKITRKVAVATLRHLAKTGKVEFERFM
jgi:hypothetical protein